MLTFFHDSRSEEYRAPFGAVPEGTKVTLSIRCYEENLGCPAEITGAELFVRFYDTKDETETESFEPSEMSLKMDRKDSGVVDTEYGPRIKTVFSCTYNTQTRGVAFYVFRFYVTERGRSFELYYGDNSDNLGGIGECFEGAPGNFYSVTVYKKGLRVPEWLKKAVIYQIFPDRFFKGYDALAEHKPNSFMYGTWDDLPMYIKGEKGIERWDFQGGNLSGVSAKLPYIEELGANVIYLNPIFKAASNHRYDTEDYMHVDGLLGGDPAFDLLVYVLKKENIRLILDGVFSHTGSDSIYFDKKKRYGGGAYRNPDSKYRDWYSFLDANDEKYDCWWGVDVLPNVNELAPGYIDFIVENDDSVVRHWLRKGASGWRLDVADELPDKFIKELNEAACDTAGETGDVPVILGEVWEDASRKFSYGKLRSYFTERELHTVTNYPFRKALLDFFGEKADAEQVYARFLSMKENYPPQSFNALVNMTGSHDVPRLMTEMLAASGNDRALARKLVLRYAAIQFTFPGVPLIYYGDETLLEGGKDPDNRRTYPWGREDRFTVSKFSELASVRRGHSCLTGGDIVFLTVSDGIFAFKRSDEKEQAFTVVSREKDPDETVRISLEDGKYDIVFGEGSGSSFEASGGSADVPFSGGCVIFVRHL